MTEKQKQAIMILNRIRELSETNHNLLTEEDYFLLLGFIIGNNPVYVPSYPTYPYITWDSKPIPVTCNDNNGSLSISGDFTFKEKGK